MTDLYLIEGLALISISGDRTSAYLLKHALDAYSGALPANFITRFANTGKEMPQTLDFVRDCGQRWNVPIIWLEYGPDWRNPAEVPHRGPQKRQPPLRTL